MKNIKTYIRNAAFMASFATIAATATSCDSMLDTKPQG